MIEKIKIGLNNLYLFKNKNDEYLLLDTGVNVKKKKILKKIIQKIENVKKIKVIVLSHSHSDHVGNLKMLVDEIGDVRVIAHKNSENVLVTGKSVIPNGFYPFTEKISKKLKSKKNFSKNIFPKLEKTDMEKVIFIDFLQKKKNYFQNTVLEIWKLLKQKDIQMIRFRLQFLMKKIIRNIYFVEIWFRIYVLKFR